MNRSTLIICLFVCLAACAPTPGAADGAPQAGLDLESLLFVSGDLPEDFTAGAQQPLPPEEPEGMPAAARSLAQKIEGPGFGGSWTASAMAGVRLYANDAEVAAAYALLDARDRTGAGSADRVEEPAGLGERALLVAIRAPIPSPGGLYVSVYTSSIVFTRCRAVVTVGIFAGDEVAEAALAYARRLDARLQPLVCR